MNYVTYTDLYGFMMVLMTMAGMFLAVILNQYNRK